MEDRVFLRSPGVVIGPNTREIAIDGKGVATFGPLEDHVLEKMRNAGDIRGFVTRAGSDPQRDGHGQGRRVRFAKDRQAV